VRAIGETGLDFYHQNDNIEQQILNFQKHVKWFECQFDICPAYVLNLVTNWLLFNLK
jgi:Tat protein secretion system quality control protein TatD with DNase activity